MLRIKPFRKVRTLLGLLDPVDDGNIFLQNLR